MGASKIFTRWGRELIACTQGVETYFYIQNIRGDVVMLIKANGNVAAIRDYDASGEMICKTPRDRDPFGFTGAMDAGNGLWKLGARFYDSGKSAFIQQDRYLGDPSDPLSLNRYVYCELDPVNFVDPMGFSAYRVVDFGGLDEFILDLNLQQSKLQKMGAALATGGAIFGIATVETIAGGLIGGIVAAYGGGMVVMGAEKQADAAGLTYIMNRCDEGGYFVVGEQNMGTMKYKVTVYDENGNKLRNIELTSNALENLLEESDLIEK